MREVMEHFVAVAANDLEITFTFFFLPLIISSPNRTMQSLIKNRSISLQRYVEVGSR